MNTKQKEREKERRDGRRRSLRGEGNKRGGHRETLSGGAWDWVGRKCVTSQIRLRNLCMKFTGGLVSLGAGACHMCLLG